jgi:hypothetical protein
MRLKRWESPRRQGRNDKGRGGSARKRQLKKQTQMLRQKLKEGNNSNDSTTKQKHQNSQGKDKVSFPYFFIIFYYYLHYLNQFQDLRNWHNYEPKKQLNSGLTTQKRSLYSNFS